MDPSVQQQIRQLLDDYLRMYSTRDDLLTGHFSEDFSGFTGGGDFLVKDRREWITITRQDFSQIKDPIHLELKDVSIQSLAETIAVATAFFAIHLPLEDNVLSRKTARLVLIFRKEPAGWKISHSSISIPFGVIREGEVYPMQELVDRNQFLEELVGERTVQLSEANDRLVQKNRELAREIEERLQSQAAKERLEIQNRQLQKAESLGRMAGAIAHHFNNKLQAVIMGVEMAMRGPADDATRGEDLAEALAAAREAAEISSLMLTYLGQASGQRQPLDLAAACGRSLTFVRAVIPTGVVLAAELPLPGPVVSANENEIRQVLTNLVTNAWEAARDGNSTISVRVHTVAAADITAVHRFPVDRQLQETAYACVEVSDTGCGVASGDIEKLFDPFFSSKFTGRGLGLPVVLGIVRAHGGAITVKSQPGLGSTFGIFLPLTTQSVVRKSAPVKRVGVAAPRATVLLVDDDAAVLRSATRALTRAGYAVHVAEDGARAVEVFRAHRGEIGCVVCDVTMPRMGGWETLTALRGLAPGVPVILASGYGEAQIMAGPHAHLPQAFLDKPYSVDELIDALDRVLAAAS